MAFKDTGDTPLVSGANALPGARVSASGEYGNDCTPTGAKASKSSVGAELSNKIEYSRAWFERRANSLSGSTSQATYFRISCLVTLAVLVWHLLGIIHSYKYPNT